MMRIEPRAPLWWTVMLLLSLLALAPASPRAAESPRVPADSAAGHPGQAECDYGIALALAGDLEGAGSAFVSLLSHAPRDARALNNLGNLALLRGRPATALSLYDRASAMDSADAGILLNEATALMLAGDEEAARQVASEGLARAGGPGPAATLLGIVPAPADTAEFKGARRSYLSKEEVVALLRQAAARVPADSLRRSPAAVARGPRLPAWRTAGPRGSALDETATLVYWKR